MSDINNSNKLELEDLQLAESLTKIARHKMIAEKANIADLIEKESRSERIRVCGSMLNF